MQAASNANETTELIWQNKTADRQEVRFLCGEKMH